MSDPDRLLPLWWALRALHEDKAIGDGRLEFLKFCAQNLHRSLSQLLQDLFVLFYLGEKRNGFFVEFGGADGLVLSNTYVLERDYAWQGLLAEPARYWHSALRRNRRSLIDTRCVWSRTGEQLKFNEAPEHELSTIDIFSNVDCHAAARSQGSRYLVETISLNDMLDHHAVPAEIDYLSVDTEGSEYQILSHFDFKRRNVNVITVEHNHTENRDRLFQLLSSQGYRRVFESFSDFDDWYVKAE